MVVAFATFGQVAKATFLRDMVKAMEFDDEDWRKRRLSDLVDKFGGKVQAGQKLGYKDGAYIGQMLRGERPITEKFTKRTQNIPGLSGWFSHPVAADQVDGGLRHSDDTSITIPLLDVAASMGYGADSRSEDAVIGALTLSPSWVNDRVKPSRSEALRFIHSYGDSMSPTFNSGDVLLVDTGVRDAKIDGVYVLKAHERLFVKRVRQRMDGVFEVSSDNPAHKTADTLNGDSQVEVLGRVLWAWNGKTI